MQGFYHAQMARLHKDDIIASKNHYSKASLAYLDATKLFPDDDEQHTCEYFRASNDSDLCHSISFQGS